MAAPLWHAKPLSPMPDVRLTRGSRSTADGASPAQPAAHPHPRAPRWSRVAVLVASVLALAAATGVGRAQELMVQAPPPLTVSPQQVSVLVGHQSEPVTVKLRLPYQSGSGTGTLVFRTLPPGVTTAPSPVSYSYQGIIGVAALGPTLAETTFRFAAGGEARPGNYDITIADGTFAVGSAKVTLTVVSAGDVGVRFRSSSLRLCGEAAADDAVVFTSLAGYQGRPSAVWSTVPAGITVTPRELSALSLPPAQTVPFKVQAAGAAPGRYTLVLTVADRRLGIAKTAELEVTVGGCGGVGIAFEKPSVSLCAGQGSVEDEVTLTPTGGYQGRPTLRWEGVPKGITITPAELAPPELPPAQTLTFSVRGDAAAPGTYALTLRATDAVAGVDSSAELRIDVGVPDFTPSVTPSSMAVQAAGGARTLQASVAGNPCFTARTVTISVSGAPSGVSVTPARVDLTGPAFEPKYFTVAVSRQAQARATFTLTFQPSAGTPKTVPVTLSVTAAPDYELTVDPSKASVAAGDAFEVTAAARSLNGFTGTIYVTTPQISGLSFSPPTFPLQLGGVGEAALVAGPGPEATQKVTINVSRRKAPGPVQVTFTGTSRPVPAAHSATVELLVLPPRPTERVEGPRIDIVKPDTLLPGKLYDLELTGKNLTLDTLISLGSDVMLVGPPIFTLPTHARVKVQVGPAALPGKRLAEASNGEGSNRGPGGVMIGLVPVVVPKRPLCAKLTTLTFVTDKLQLEEPEWGKHWEGEFQQDYGIPLLDDDTLFQWRESSPGTADYFELRIYDKQTGALLVTRRVGSQTLRVGSIGFSYVPRYFRPDAAFLAELLPKVTRRSMTFRTAADWATVNSVAVTQPLGQQAVQPSPQTATQGLGKSPVTLGKPAAVTPTLAQPVAGGQAKLPGVEPQIDPTAGADLLWEVAGFKLYDPDCVIVRTGQEIPKPEADGKIHMQVQLSDRWPLRVPNNPTGIDCPGGKSARGSLNLDPLSNKDVLDENGNVVYDVVGGKQNPRIDPNNYPGDVFGLSGEFDLSFSPWATHPKTTMEAPPGGQLAVNIAQLDFDTLFVDWGDGTVEPVRIAFPVKGNEPVMAWGRGVKIELPNPKGQTPAPGSLRHSYDRTGTFTIRFFQLSEEDAQHVAAAQLAMAIDGPQGSPYFAILAAEAGSGRSFPAAGGAPAAGSAAQAPVMTAASPASIRAAGGGGVGLAARPNVSATLADWQMSSSRIIARAYMLYCNTLTITEREDTRASGPLHLDAIAVTGFPGHEPEAAKGGRTARPTPPRATVMAAGPPPVTVSTCDESLTAQATLRYFGKGKVRITWMLDGVAFSTEEKDIGPSEQAKNLGRDPRTWPPPVLSEVGLDSDQLSVEKLGLHKVTVDAEVVPEPTIPNIRFATRVVTDAVQGLAPAAGDLAVAKAILGSGGGPPGDPLRVNVLAPGQSASTGLPAFVSLRPAADSVLAGVRIVKEKPLFVASAPKTYQVVGGEAGKPCVFVFPTKLGEFRISGLEDSVTNVGTTYSGKAVLMLPLTKDSTSARRHAVEVTFSGWEVPDLQHVVKGTLDVSPDRVIDGPGLQGTLSRLAGEAGTTTELDATFDLKPKDATLRIPGGVERPPEWKGVTAPVTGSGPGLVEGDWYLAGEKLPEVLIGWSAFKIRSGDVRLDWSRAEGDGASSQCEGGGGASWVGVHLGHATLTPYTMDLVGQGGAYEQSVTDWGIVDAGLCGAVDTKPWKASIGEGWVGFDAIHVVARRGTFDALYKNMKLHLPWPETEFGGDARLQSGGGTSAGIGFPFMGSAPLQQYNDAPNRISMTANNLFFTQEENVGWAVRADTDFDLMAEGKHLAAFTADGMFFGFDGRAYFEKGTPSTTIALSGHSVLGDTPLDLNSVTLTAATSGTGRLHFAVKVTAHLSETLPAAGAQVNYDITRPGPAYAGSGPVTSPFAVQVAFPAGSPALQANISPHYEGAEDTRFYGPVDLAMFGGPPIKAEFLLGYENGRSYWLTRASFPLGQSGTPLVPPVLNLYMVRGGLGYNFPIDAFKNAASIKDAQPDFSGNFMFMAGMRVGSPDGGFAFTLDGDLTISPAVGARMDFHAWLVKNQHEGNGDFAGYFQWANGNFDGRLWGGLNLLDGVVKFDLGSSEATAAVALHFGSGDWYVHAGAKEGPRIKATVMNIGNVDAYLMLSNKGLEVGGSMSIYLGCSIGHVKGWAEAGLGITPAPGIFGHADAGLEAEVCAFDVCIGVGVTAGINFSALPVSIGCHACVEIPIPFWNPEVCGDFSL